MFKVGDIVCYPMHGLVEIEAIEERKVLDITSSYYVLRFVIGKMTAMVPVDMADRVGLRYVIPEEECVKLVDYMKAEPCEENGNWNQRYRDNYEKLRGGDVYDIADVVKCLMRRETEKGLSSGERRMLTNARQMLVAELAESSGWDSDRSAKSLGL